MPRIDPFGRRCDYCVRVHIRLAANLDIDIHQAVYNAQRLYGSSGIFFDTPTTTSIALTAADFGRLSVINGECNWNQESSEQKELLDRVNAEDLTGITAVFVSGIETSTGPLNGCAGHALHRAGVMIGSACTPWTLSHEVGHVLLGPGYSPVHTTSPNNIMFHSSASFKQSSNPSFDFAQIDQIRRSRYVTRC